MIDSYIMAPFRFKRFQVYQDAKAFRQHVLSLVSKLVERRAFDLANQIRRASLSIILNIAEGSAKKSDIEFARFLETSTGSVNEVVAGFNVAHDDGVISDAENMSIEREAGKIIMQLGGFMKSLRNKRGSTISSHHRLHS